MVRGEKEQNCLDIVKQIVFYNNGQIRRDFFEKSYLDVSDEEFYKNSWCYFDFNQNAFGLSQKDRIEITDSLRKAKANESASNFPDFIFENGFIEHFQITSSKETKKGSAQAIAENDFNRRAERTESEFQENCNNNPDFDNIRTISTTMEVPKHESDYLHSSFKRNFEKHIESLGKYDGSTQIGIFMIENFEFAVHMMENIGEGLKENVSYGDLWRPQKFRCYRLSRDRAILQYLYDFRDKVKYIIYVYNDFEHRKGATGFESFYIDNISKIEIIKTENIPYILKLLPWEFIISPVHCNIVRTVSCISTKIDGSEKNDET